MSDQAAKRLAEKYAGRLKTAGEVRFVKDHQGDEKQWGWNSAPGPEQRTLGAFEFKSKNIKPGAGNPKSWCWTKRTRSSPNAESKPCPRLPHKTLRPVSKEP